MSIFCEWELEDVVDALSGYRVKWRDMEAKACIKPERRILILNPYFSDLEDSVMHELGHHIENEMGFSGRYAHQEIEHGAIEFLREHPEVRSYLTEYVENHR